MEAQEPDLDPVVMITSQAIADPPPPQVKVTYHGRTMQLKYSTGHLILFNMGLGHPIIPNISYYSIWDLDTL
jgi:hypothetical protein